MLRMQPYEIVKCDADHLIARCDAPDRKLDFHFTVTQEKDGSGELRRNVPYPDSLFFVSYDDHGGWALLTSVAIFEGIATGGERVLGLSKQNFVPVRLRCVETSEAESRKYTVTFVAGDFDIEKVFYVDGAGTERTVRCENRCWSLRQEGVWWRVGAVSNALVNDGAGADDGAGGTDSELANPGSFLNAGASAIAGALANPGGLANAGALVNAGASAHGDKEADAIDEAAVSIETKLLKAIVFFDESRTHEYTEEQLREREHAVDWDLVMRQSEINAQLSK